MMMRRSKSQDDAVMNMCRLYHDDVSSVKMVVNFMLPKRRFSFVMAKLVSRSKADHPIWRVFECGKRVWKTQNKTVENLTHDDVSVELTR
jgi:hypothetical protein